MNSRDIKENTNKRKDRQTIGQTSLTPFMNIREGSNKNVTLIQ